MSLAIGIVVAALSAGASRIVFDDQFDQTCHTITADGPSDGIIDDLIRSAMQC